VRRIPVLVLAVAAVVALAGCTTSIPTPAPTAHPIVAKAVAVPDGVVGTGTLTSWNGKTTGTLQVLAKAGRFTFVLSHFATDFIGENSFVLADSPLTMSECPENNRYQAGLSTMQNNVIEPTMTFPLLEDGHEWDDPTFFTTFAFIQYGPWVPTGSRSSFAGASSRSLR
jgi:hypothetical protein